MPSVTVTAMRRPVNQHRALAAVKAGRVVRLRNGTRATGSWQWWDDERWRPVSSGESHALDKLIAPTHDMIKVSNPGEVREEFELTEFGEITLRLWDEKWCHFGSDRLR